MGFVGGAVILAGFAFGGTALTRFALPGLALFCPAFPSLAFAGFTLTILVLLTGDFMLFSSYLVCVWRAGRRRWYQIFLDACNKYAQSRVQFAAGPAL